MPLLTKNTWQEDNFGSRRVFQILSLYSGLSSKIQLRVTKVSGGPNGNLTALMGRFCVFLLKTICSKALQWFLVRIQEAASMRDAMWL